MTDRQDAQEVHLNQIFTTAAMESKTAGFGYNLTGRMLRVQS